MKTERGFTLAEILVVMSIMAVVGAILVAIFANTLKGSNKAQVLAVVKQNGQAVLDNLDKTIRSADDVICPASGTFGSTLVIRKDGCFTRYRFIDPTSSQNGQIQQDSPQPDPDTNCPQNSPAPSPTALQGFINNVCTDPMGNPTNILTDTNTRSGVSIQNNAAFTRNTQAGFKDSVTIKFVVKPAVGLPISISDQITPVTFQTTIQLR